MAKGCTMKWFDELSSILLGFRSTFKEVISITPAEMVYRQNLRIPVVYLIVGLVHCPLVNSSSVVFDNAHELSNVEELLYLRFSLRNAAFQMPMAPKQHGYNRCQWHLY
uniref:Uncharacterized protein n=1 Tax=Glossina pallidipes TaxID=7398 RepID=A0A1A9ZLI4_GLOPL